MDNHFGGVIWTNHALARLRERGISQSDAWATWRRPQLERKGKSGNWVFYRNFSSTRIEVVAKKNEKGEWLILSVWSKPLSNDNSKKESFWKFIFERIFP